MEKFVKPIYSDPTLWPCAFLMYKRNSSSLLAFLWFFFSSKKFKKSNNFLFSYSNTIAFLNLLLYHWNIISLLFHFFFISYISYPPHLNTAQFQIQNTHNHQPKLQLNQQIQKPIWKTLTNPNQHQIKGVCARAHVCRNSPPVDGDVVWWLTSRSKVDNRRPPTTSSLITQLLTLISSSLPRSFDSRSPLNSPPPTSPLHFQWHHLMQSYFLSLSLSARTKQEGGLCLNEEEEKGIACLGTCERRSKQFFYEYNKALSSYRDSKCIG